MTAFELIVKLTADSSKFNSAMASAKKSGSSLGNSLGKTFSKIKTAAAGALSVVAIKKGIESVISFANEVSAAGDRIDKQSQILGMSRKAFQEWDYILGQNGVSIDSMGTSMKTLNSQILDASSGSEDAKKSFSKLGLGIHEIEQLSPEEQFEAVVRAFQKMPPSAKKSALAVELFGRQGQELLPLLNSSETSIDEMRQQMAKLGLYMSDDAVDASVTYGDSLDTLKKTFNSIKYAVGAKVLPVLTTGIQNITEYAGKLKTAYDDNGLAGVWEQLVTDFNNIQWPDIGELVTKFSTWWNDTAVPALRGAMVWTLTLFGVPTETAEQITSLISEWWDGIKADAEAVLGWFLHLPATPTEAGEELGKRIQTWWNDKMRALAEGALQWYIGLFGIGDREGQGTLKQIKTWWDTQVAPFLADSVKFVLGLFGLPSPEEMVKSVLKWWAGVKEQVGDLILNIVPNILGIGGAGGEDHDVYTPGRNGLEPGIIAELPGNAKGMPYVPMDNYLTRLHRGERVLTASQNRRYSQGRGSVDLSGMMQGIVGAVQAGMADAQVNSYMDGRRVTGDVNRRTLNQLKARRFAT